MNRIELWNTALKSKFRYFDSIEQLNEYCKFTSYLVKNKYQVGDKYDFIIDSLLDKKGISITYTDFKHPIAVFDDSKKKHILINSDYYEQNKKKIIGLSFANMLSENPSIVANLKSNIIELDTFTKDKLNMLLLFPDDKEIILYSNNITNEYYDKVYMIANYLEQIGKKAKLKIFTYTKNSVDGNVADDDNVAIDDKLNTINAKARMTFINSKLNNLKLQNVSIEIFHNSTISYSLDEFNEENERLKKILESIITDEMSPFEKYIAIYNYVKNFKPYKENYDNPDESRYLKYILDNDYIVCVGYANLMSELLNMAGIEAYTGSYPIDVSYKDGFTLENKVIQEIGHARVFFNIVDPKYDIDGFFISDPTNGYGTDDNELNYAIISKSESEKERFTEIFKKTPIFIFSALDFNDFDEKTNYVLKNEIEKNYALIEKENKEKKSQNEVYHLAILKSYQYICRIIIDVLNNLDSEKALYFMSKKCETEEEYKDFLTEFGHYLVKKNNCNVSGKKILDADLEVKKLQTDFNEKELRLYAITTKLYNADGRRRYFPFEFMDENYNRDLNKPNKFM